MSILIKGMEMPTKCIICPLEMYGYCLANNKKNVGESVVDFVKDEDCPLIPVPPHGGLCDKTALIDKIGENIDKAKDRSYDWWYACTVAYDFALAALTIIPAELPVHHGTFGKQTCDSFLRCNLGRI